MTRTPAMARTAAPAAWARAFLLALTALVMLSATQAATAQPKGAPGSFAPLVDRLAPAVVNISSEGFVERPRRRIFPEGSPFEEFFNRDGDDEEPEERRVRSLGSGFIIDAKGYIVTNNHVVREADEIRVTTVGGDEYEAEIVGRDADTDLALLKIEADVDLPHVNWGDSDAARVGDWVLAIGNPFGLGGTVTSGIVSAKGRDQIAGGGRNVGEYFQTDAPINRGNSGGPLFDLDGNVIGVNTAIFSPSGGSVGIGFAITSNFAKRVVDSLRESGKFRRGYIGVRIENVIGDMAEALGVDEGALIAEVTKGSPADKAGLRHGDVVTRFAGRDVDSSSELAQVAALTPVGETVEVQYVRQGKTRTTRITLAEFPDDLANAAVAGHGMGGDDDGSSAQEMLGMDLSAVSDELRERMDLDRDLKGVVVMDLTRRSEAWRIGVRPGDVILEVNQSPVSKPEDLADRIAEAREDGRSAVLLYLYRPNGDSFFHRPLALENGDGEEG
nr:DegQ family serine endoprotease [Rhodothalassium salexigens]